MVTGIYLNMLIMKIKGIYEFTSKEELLIFQMNNYISYLKILILVIWNYLKLYLESLKDQRSI